MGKNHTQAGQSSLIIMIQHIYGNVPTIIIEVGFFFEGDIPINYGYGDVVRFIIIIKRFRFKFEEIDHSLLTASCKMWAFDVN